jgi:hypothetical protein
VHELALAVVEVDLDDLEPLDVRAVLAEDLGHIVPAMPLEASTTTFSFAAQVAVLRTCFT